MTLAAADLEPRVAQLLAEYAAVSIDPSAPLDPALTLTGDLGIESLSLVSLMLRLAEELEVDLVALGTDLSQVATVGDLLQLCRSLVESVSS